MCMGKNRDDGRWRREYLEKSTPVNRGETSFGQHVRTHLWSPSSNSNNSNHFSSLPMNFHLFLVEHATRTQIIRCELGIGRRTFGLFFSSFLGSEKCLCSLTLMVRIRQRDLLLGAMLTARIVPIEFKSTRV